MRGIRALRRMGYDIPRLALDKRAPTRTEAGKAGLPSAGEVVAQGLKVMRDISLDDGNEPPVRIVAASKLVDAFGGADKAYEVLEQPRTATELLEAIREALPELERRAAQESASVAPSRAISCQATVQAPADEKGPQLLEEQNPWESTATDS